MNHKELENLRGMEPSDPHQCFLWRILRLGVINPKAVDKPTDPSTRSMRHTSAIGMRLWKMWQEAKSWVSTNLFFLSFPHADMFFLGRSLRGNDEGSVVHSGKGGCTSLFDV